jgi:hypothetical protein
MEDAFRAKRWRDFRRRAEYAPDSVYRHRTRGWEYIPVHPFGDEPDVLARLGLRPEDCRTADAWWGIEDDATLIESGVVGVVPGPAVRQGHDARGAVGVSRGGLRRPVRYSRRVRGSDGSVCGCRVSAQR